MGDVDEGGEGGKRDGRGGGGMRENMRMLIKIGLMIKWVMIRWRGTTMMMITMTMTMMEKE